MEALVSVLKLFHVLSNDVSRAKARTLYKTINKSVSEMGETAHVTGCKRAQGRRALTEQGTASADWPPAGPSNIGFIVK